MGHIYSKCDTSFCLHHMTGTLFMCTVDDNKLGSFGIIDANLETEVTVVFTKLFMCTVDTRTVLSWHY